MWNSKRKSLKKKIFIQLHINTNEILVNPTETYKIFEKNIIKHENLKVTFKIYETIISKNETKLKQFHKKYDTIYMHPLNV